MGAHVSTCKHKPEDPAGMSARPNRENARGSPKKSHRFPIPSRNVHTSPCPTQKQDPPGSSQLPVASWLPRHILYLVHDDVGHVEHHVQHAGALHTRICAAGVTQLHTCSGTDGDALPQHAPPQLPAILLHERSKLVPCSSHLRLEVYQLQLLLHHLQRVALAVKHPL